MIRSILLFAILLLLFFSIALNVALTDKVERLESIESPVCQKEIGDEYALTEVGLHELMQD